MVREIVSALGDAWADVAGDAQIGPLVARSFVARHEPQRARQVRVMMGVKDAELEGALAQETAAVAAPEQVRVVPLPGPIWSLGLGAPPWLQKLKPARGGPAVGVLAWSVAS